MSAVRYVPDLLGIEGIAMSAEVMADLKTLADAAADWARQNGPIDRDADEHYVDDITVDVGIEDDKALARINANNWKAWLIEAGTEHTEAHATLRRGAESAGLNITE